LIARNAEKLTKVAKEIQLLKTPSGKPPRTKIIVNDFSKNFDSKTFEEIYE